MTFEVIDIEGSPRERGRSYGEQARLKVQGTYELYAASLSEFDRSEEIAEVAFAEIEKKVSAWAPDLYEEIIGIAEGANLRAKDVLFINCRSELLQLARRGSEPLDEPIDGCTGAILLPEISENGKLIHGQNWDWRTESADISIVLRIKRDDGPNIMTFTEAGGIGRIGMNTSGVSITGLHLESDRDYKSTGIPVPFIRRRALDSDHFAKAIKVVAGTPKYCSNNMMLSTKEGYAINFECAPNETFTIHPTDGMIVHSNHWQSQVALTKLVDTGYGNNGDSYYRDRRVLQLLNSKNGKLSIADLKSAFRDDFCHPFSVCRPPLEKTVGNLSATVATVIMVPEDGVMEVASLPAAVGVYTRYELPQKN